MYALPNTLICTVGTSLFYPNLARLQIDQYDNCFSNTQEQNDYQALKKTDWLKDLNNLHQVLQVIKDKYNNKDWPLLAKQLLKLPSDLRLLGAEINSVEAMVRKHFLSDNRERIILLISETEEGQDIGNILKEYFTNKGCPIHFKNAKVYTVQGLQDSYPKDFQRKGLPNLVRLLGRELRKWSSQYTAINATGGYKAQIAIAVAFGQVTKIPVYYKHERFDQIIPFPKVPFSIDLSLVDDYLQFWSQLAEPEAIFTYEQIAEYIGDNNETFDLMTPLLESIHEDGIDYYALSALGLIYWEEYLNRHPDIFLDPPKADKRRGCAFRDDNYPEGFKEYVNKVYSEFDFITGCHSLPYSGQRGITSNRFYIKSDKIYGEYVDRNDFGARFEIATNTHNQLERQGALNKLNEWLDNSDFSK